MDSERDPVKGVSFDLSKTRTGICHWNDKQPVAVHSHSFTHTNDIGHTLASLRNNLPDFMLSDLHWIAFEDVRPVNKNHSEIHFGMVGVLAEWCYRRNVPLLRATAGAVKKALAGTGKADKDQMLAAARERFPELNVQNHDEADAVGVGLVAVSMIEWNSDVPEVPTDVVPF